jgi:cytochrome c oxidase subunit 3
MSQVLALHGPYDVPRQRLHALRLAMWLFVASELMFFAALFGLYAAARADDPETFGRCTMHNALELGTLNTVVLLTSSFAVALSIAALRDARARRAALLLGSAVALGFVFLGVKSYEYAGHFREGVYPGALFHDPALGRATSARAFFNLYFAMTGLHALHVIVGMGLLAWVAFAAARGRLGPAEEDHARAELVGLYWHLVDIVWLFLWPLFYLIH